MAELHYREMIPEAPLSSHVRCVWRLTAPSSLAAGAPEPIIPDGCVEVILNLADPFVQHTAPGVLLRQPLSLVAGQLTRAITLGPTGRVDLWGIRFHPWSAPAFLDVSGRELRDTVAPLGDLASSLERALSTVGDRSSDADQYESIVAVLMRRMKRARRVDRVTHALVDVARLHSQPMTVRTLARRTGLSVRRVEMLFRDDVGLTPKQLLRLSRFQQAISLRRRDMLLSWATIAVRAGFFDQAHLIHESNEIAGCSPTALFGGEVGLTESFVTE